MPTYNTSSVNSAVFNAEDVVDKVKNGEIIYSFFMGGTESEVINASSEEKRKDAWKNASFFQKMDPTSIDIVVDKNDFAAKPFSTWKSTSDVLNNFYCYYNGNVYLVISNNGNNTVSHDGIISPSTNDPPTHTFGIQKYGEYEFLFLFSVQAQDSVVLSGNLHIPVPKTGNSLDYFKGSLLYKRIDTNALSSTVINKNNPTIPILSDTGVDASITLVTKLVSSPGTTDSKKQYKIVGIQAEPGRNYQDYDLEDSIDEVLGEETGTVRNAIKNAITIGFSPMAISARLLLQANQSLITIATTATEISSVTDQQDFFTHGIIRDVLDTGGNPLFKSTDTGTSAIKANNVKFETSKTPIVGASTDRVGNSASTLFLVSGSTTRQKGKIASSKVSGSNLASEVQVHTNPYKKDDGVKAGKNGATFIITSITEPEASQGSGSVLNTGDTQYSISGDVDHFPKTFIVQYINRYN